MPTKTKKTPKRRSPSPEIDWSAFESTSETLLTNIEANPGETADDLLHSFEDKTVAKKVLSILARHEICVDSAGRHFIDKTTMDRYH